MGCTGSKSSQESNGTQPKPSNERKEENGVGTDGTATTAESSKEQQQTEQKPKQEETPSKSVKGRFSCEGHHT